MSISDEIKVEKIHSMIWAEDPEPDDPFTAARCYCAGYNVYDDLVGKVSWFEYLYLLFNRERPTDVQVKLLESIAVAIANPGPRDHSVRAAMSAAAGGSTSASALIAALAVGAGKSGGARELYLSMTDWLSCGNDIKLWQQHLISNKASHAEGASIWPPIDHPSGFEPYSCQCSTPVLRVLGHLITIKSDGLLSFLQKKRPELEEFAQRPISMVSVVSAGFLDIGFNPQQGELLYLLFRLSGSAAHYTEQYLKWMKYPFFADGLHLADDPNEE